LTRFFVRWVKFSTPVFRVLAKRLGRLTGRQPWVTGGRGGGTDLKKIKREIPHSGSGETRAKPSGRSGWGHVQGGPGHDALLLLARVWGSRPTPVQRGLRAHRCPPNETLLSPRPLVDEREAGLMMSTSAKIGLFFGGVLWGSHARLPGRVGAIFMIPKAHEVSCGTPRRTRFSDFGYCVGQRGAEENEKKTIV